MKEFWNKVKSLNSWSWIALFGYIELAIAILFLLCSFFNIGLIFGLILMSLGTISIISLPLVIIIIELCGFKLRRIINNPFITIIGILINIGIISLCIFAN